MPTPTLPKATSKTVTAALIDGILCSRKASSRALSSSPCHDLVDGFRIHRGDVRTDDLPSFGEAHPHLRLPPDLVCTADVVFQVHRCHVATEGEDLEPAARFLRARSRRAPHAVGVD